MNVRMYNMLMNNVALVGGGRRSSHDDSPLRPSQLTSDDVTSQSVYSPPFKGQPVKAWAQGELFVKLYYRVPTQVLI